MPESGSAIRPNEAARPHTGSAGNPNYPTPDQAIAESQILWTISDLFV